MKGAALPLVAVVVFAGVFFAVCSSTAPAPALTAGPALRTAAAPVEPTVPPGSKAVFPEKGKAVTIVIPFAAGGATDVAGRLLASGLEKALGVPVLIANRPGASGQTGVQEMLQSKPDGYTLAEASTSTIVTQIVDPSRRAIFKSRQDFTLVAGHHKNLHILAVRASSPWKTLKDLAEHARTNPNKVRVSDSGLLSAPHLIGLIFQRSAGVSFAFVHFSGGAESVPALLGGHVEVLAAGVTDVIPFVKSGEVRVLGIADTQESQFLPGVPTMVSQGYNVPAVSGTGVLGPKGMPKEVVDILTSAIRKVLEGAELQKKMTDLGFVVRYLNPGDYAKVWDETEGLVGPITKQILQDQKK